MRPESKYRGSFKLSAIGDALGWITEFEKNKEGLIAKYGVEKIVKFQDWHKPTGGRFHGYIDHISSGSYSDDTQLMLAVARSLRDNGDVDNDYFAKRELPNWLYYSRGGGRTVKVAAEKITRKSVKWNTNFFSHKVKDLVVDYRNSGANGAAMRILPIALANLGDFNKVKYEIFKNSIVTHGHPRAIVGAILYGHAVCEIITSRSDNFNWETYLTRVGTEMPFRYSIDFGESQELTDWLRLWNMDGNNFESIYNETIQEAQNALRFIFTSLKRNEPIDFVYNKLGCLDPSTKGSGIATVVAAIYVACRFFNYPLDGIYCSVNMLGSDTDTIAAFVGGLLGALHGNSIIPKSFRTIQDDKYLESIADNILAISEGRDWSLNTPQYWVTDDITKLEVSDIDVGRRVCLDPLGLGKVVSLEIQPSLTKGKANRIFDIELEIGQSIRVALTCSVIASQSVFLKDYDYILSRAKLVMSQDSYYELEELFKFSNLPIDKFTIWLNKLLNQLPTLKD